MRMVCGLDLHRQQIAFNAEEMESGEVWRGHADVPPSPVRLHGDTTNTGGIAGGTVSLAQGRRRSSRQWWWVDG